MDSADFYSRVLLQCLGHEIQVGNVRRMSGGCINQTVCLETDDGNFFLKWNDAKYEDMFCQEAFGLNLLSQHFPYNVPNVYGFGVSHSKSFLLMDFLDQAPRGPDFWTNLGIGLAALHRVSNPGYGLERNNYIGRLAQHNQWRYDWIDFFVEMRLEIQLEMAIENGYVDKSFVRRFRSIYARLPQLLPTEPPALIHGDLWSGNLIIGPDGQGGLIDPAVYYGSREIELAFTRLFGGFDLDFYSSYQQEFPLQPGFEERVDLYNLYPLLVHLNLFGTAYYNGIESTISRFA